MYEKKKGGISFWKKLKLQLFLPGEFQERGSLVGCRLWGRTESDMTEVMRQQQQQQTTLSAPWESCVQVKKQQLEPDMEQRTGSKLGKKYIKAVYCHPAYLKNFFHGCWNKTLIFSKNPGSLKESHWLQSLKDGLGH